MTKRWVELKARMLVLALSVSAGACSGGDAGASGAGRGGALGGQGGAAGSLGGGSGGVQSIAGAGGVSGGASGVSGGASGVSGGASGAGGVGGALGDSETVACIESLRASCDARVRCLEAPTDPAVAERLTRECVAEDARQCPDVLFSEGSLRTADASIACVQAWRTHSCDDFRASTAPACAVAGSRLAGERCAFNTQCASRQCLARGAECGTCASIVGVGESCIDGDAVCEEGLYCTLQGCAADAPPPPPARPSLGEECDPFGTRCAGETWCGYDAAAGGPRCLPLPGAGADCAMSEACAAGYYCAWQQAICVALPGVDQPCGDNVNSGWECAADLYCEPPALTCGTQMDGSFGCTQSDMKFCRERPVAGAVCEEHIGCSDGSDCVCDDAACATRHCGTLRFPGESCTGGSDLCIPVATRCEGGVCVANGSQGLFDAWCGP